MNASAAPKKRPTVLVVIDDRLPRDRAVALGRMLDQLGKLCSLQTLRSRDLEEPQLLAQIEAQKPKVVLAPWYRYLAWTRIDTRLSSSNRRDTIFAGYFADAIRPHDLEELTLERNRAILLDWTHLQASEVALALQGMVRESTRTGIRPLLRPDTLVYTENWGDRNGMGFRFDQIARVPGMDQPEAQARLLSTRLILTSLWGLVYEDGSGKSDLSNAVNRNVANASFQFAVDAGGIFIRLCTPLKTWTPADVARAFWPSVKSSTQPAQLLLRHADYVRVFLFPESQQVEILVALLPSAPSQKHPNLVHSFWVDTLPSSQLTEKPYAEVDSKIPWLRPFPSVPVIDAGKVQALETRVQTLDDLLFKAGGRIHELKKAIKERDEQLTEMRSGGVGLKHRLDPPEAEELLEAFGERLEKAQLQMRDYFAELARLEAEGARQAEIDSLDRKIESLRQRQNEWLRQLAQTLQSHRKRSAG